MRIIVVIPARGGSKGIPDKNIQPLLGKPLIGYTIEAALKAKVSSDIYVSTDSVEIAAVASGFGARVIDRPKEISLDDSSTESALIHAVETVGGTFDYILTLPATSPLRRAETITAFIDYFKTIHSEYDAQLSLTETRNDYWVKKGEEISRLFPNAARRRQDREPIFLENSAIYITKVSSLLETKSILGHHCSGYIIDEIESVDINTYLDLSWAEFLLKNRLKR
ncbi:MAG: acylneuraminate cytidylyltransferase family protein [Candidatus Omnitrophica bacterium]|nr:acylneuraminate cytidylyltransferase family protein [Candidatus Omnitrophota bacterium]